MNSLTEMLAMDTKNDCSISIVSTWISDPLFNTSVLDQRRQYLQTKMSKHWTFRIHSYSLTNFGSQLFGICWCVQLKICTTDSFYHTEEFPPCSSNMRDVSMTPIIYEALNTLLQSCIALPSKDTYKDPFGYHSGDCSPIIVEKRMQMLFRESLQPQVLYWM